MGAAEFGQRLRDLREAAGLTQGKLAEVAGLTLDGISQLERGRRLPGWDTVLALAKSLGVPCTAFEGAEDGSAAEASTAAPRRAGRPRKAEAPEPAASPAGPADDAPPPQRKPARRKPRKPRGG
jgi:transcriptional regulator with XRE-family HTH domain